jgi:hypothetical protein
VLILLSEWEESSRKIPDRIGTLDMIKGDLGFCMIIVGRKHGYPGAVDTLFNVFHHTDFYYKFSLAAITYCKLPMLLLAFYQARMDAVLIADNPKMYLHASHPPRGLSDKNLKMFQTSKANFQCENEVGDPRIGEQQGSAAMVPFDGETI